MCTSIDRFGSIERRIREAIMDESLRIKKKEFYQTLSFDTSRGVVLVSVFYSNWIFDDFI